MRLGVTLHFRLNERRRIRDGDSLDGDSKYTTPLSEFHAADFEDPASYAPSVLCCSVCLY